MLPISVNTKSGAEGTATATSGNVTAPYPDGGASSPDSLMKYALIGAGLFIALIVLMQFRRR